MTKEFDPAGDLALADQRPLSPSSAEDIPAHHATEIKDFSESEFSDSWPLFNIEVLVLIVWSVASGITYNRLALGINGDIPAFAATGFLIGLVYCGSEKIFRAKMRITMRRKLEPLLHTLAFWCSSFLILSFFAFSFRISQELSRGAVLGFFFTGLLVLAITRVVAIKLFARRLFKASLRWSDAVIVGSSERALFEATEGFKARGCVAPSAVKINSSCRNSEWPFELQSSIRRTTEIAHQAAPGAIYVCAQDFPEDRLYMLLEGLQMIPRAVRIIPDAITTHLMTFPIRNEVGGVSVEVQRSPLSTSQRALKRAFDVVVSLTGTIFLLPLFIIIAFAIALDSHGPVIFRQTRLGHRGRPFKIVKFRTMHVMEDGSDIQHVEKNDRRVTRVGKVLRITSLDELPQLINVIMGEMSLVGPRPHAVAHDRRYASLIPNYELRQHVKPGMTGWAQVHGMRGDTATPDLMPRRVEYDVWYAKNASFALDVEILLRTIAVLAGSERLEDLHSPLKTTAEVTRVLGVPVNVIDMNLAVNTITSWVRDKKANYVCVRDVHGVMQAQNDPEFRKIHEDAALVTPDGMPLVWISRAHTRKSVGRVCGADLVDALCAASVKQRLRHYFYGGKPGVAEKMAIILQTRYPGLQVVGTCSPPFGVLLPEQDEHITQAINASKPDIVWVGLSSPKQEYWMRDHVERIAGATLIGVGAAFDFHTGEVARAPVWMQRRGLEWLHRLYSEPTRLWRRYLVMVPIFIVRVFGEQILPSAWCQGIEMRSNNISKRIRIKKGS